MTGTPRIVVFALVLAGVFAAAAAVGRAVGPLERGSEPAEAHAEDEGTTMEPEGPAGLAVAEGGLRLEVVRERPFAFRVVRDGGAPVRGYDVEHERRMHLIAVRRDLTGFVHMHPTLRAGTWETALRPARPGPYRVFADFSSGGERRTLGVDLTVPGLYDPEPLPAPSRHATVAGYEVELERRGGVLEFRVLRDGRRVRVQPYLGARGHLVILREGDLAYLHNHAARDALRFETSFPSAGRYRAFLQFRHAGSVRTAAFTLEVGR